MTVKIVKIVKIVKSDKYRDRERSQLCPASILVMVLALPFNCFWRCVELHKARDLSMI